MAEQRKFQAIKGVRDILPPESAQWNRVEQTAREVFATYGYGEIRLPIFEETELFARSVGVDTDIVNKEMFPVADPALSALERDRLKLIASKAESLSKPEDRGEFGLEVEVFLNFVSDAAKKESFSYEGQERIFQLLLEANKRASETFLQPNAEQNDWSAYVYEVKNLLKQMDLHVNWTLRPEATASVCRAYIEHGMQTWPGNVKLYYIGPMFRREKPQKGRYRQFYQIGAEVLTTAPQREETDKDRRTDAAIDAEVIEMLMAFFERVGLGRTAAILAAPSENRRLEAGGTTLYINSIGCKECRPAYVAKLKAALIEHINELKADSQRRVETNPLRVLDSKLPEEQPVIEKLPRITEHLCEACGEHYAEVKKQLDIRGVAYQENWRLVRGLDYYMRTTFEITAPGLGAQNAVCGGGRYDGLVELLGGPPTKGIGFAIGTDRVILSLQERAQQAAPLQTLDVFVAWMGAAAQPEAVKLARKLRDAGLSVEVPAEEMKFKKSIGLADKLGARYALIIGENELKEGKYALKRLSDGVQEKIGAGELISAVRKIGV